MGGLPGPRVLILTGDQTGCELWRAWWPVAALQVQGYPVQWMRREDPRGLEAAMQAQAVVLNRLSWQSGDYGKAVRWRAMLHNMGVALLYESDDDLWTDALLAHSRIMEPEKPLDVLAAERQMRLDSLRLADGITVSSPRLATLVRTLTDKPVVVVPNAIPWTAWQQECARGRRLTDAVTIGWAGGKRQDHDLVPMAEAWGRIARRYPAVRFILVGHQAAVIQAAVPAAQLLLVPWQPLDLYPRAYHGWTIGCCPLADTAFNRCKTPIKAYEYAAAGAAVVYSTPVYGRVMRPGLDGLEANTADEWEAALATLLDDPTRRQQMAARWAKRVRERHSLAENLWRWPAAWESLVNATRGRKRLVAV